MQKNYDLSASSVSKNSDTKFGKKYMEFMIEIIHILKYNKRGYKRINKMYLR